MFRNIAKTFFVILTISFLAVLFCSCNDTSLYATYYFSTTENDEPVTYTLHIDEKKSTFAMNVSSVPEINYTGNFTTTKGYLILTSTEKGTQYVSLVGDKFSFFYPVTDEVECDHYFVFKEEVEGTCSAKGYKKYVCSVCDKEMTEQTVYGKHSYVLTSHKSGDCTNRSSSSYVCSICGDAKTEYGQYGDHDLTETTTTDLGCEYKITVTYSCSICKKYNSNEQTNEYGSHSYGDDDICAYCGYDKTGICHRHTDINDDGICDDCLMSISILSDIRSNGYYADGDELYFGFYPTSLAQYSVDSIETNGKFDKTTGFYRYRNSSFLIASVYDYSAKKNEKAAFALTYLVWKKTLTADETATYVCSSVIDKKVFFAGEKIKDNHHADDPETAANDYLASDIYAFANGEFLSSFSAKQLSLFAPGSFVSLPVFSEETPLIATKTDYSVFVSANGSTDYYFTVTEGDTAGKVIVCSRFSNSSFSSVHVSEKSGFLPVITLIIG